MVAESVFSAVGAELVVTSVTEGKHSPGSLHYVGLACDLRSNTLTPAQRVAIAQNLKEALGAEFDVVMEATHIHVEFQPKS